MNKTITANISGIVFNIDVDAYDFLNQYLSKIKSHFKNSVERNEIMQDIESRIAELFSEMLTKNRNVIGQADVEKVISIMGKPEDYFLDEDEQPINPHYTNNESTHSRKLFRNPDERVLGGVCSGIGAFVGIDTVWIRLAFVAALFIGFGFILYLVLWIVMPEAKTVSDKLKMKGAPINIESIKKTFEDETQKVNESFKKMNDDGVFKKIGKTFENLIKAFVLVVVYLLKAILKFIAVIMLFVGVSFLIVMVATFFGSSMIFSFTEGGFMMLEYHNLFNLFFASKSELFFAILGLTLLIGVPIFTIIYLSISIIFKKKFGGNMAKSLLLLFIIGLSLTIFEGLHLGRSMSKLETSTKTLPLNDVDSILNIKTLNNDIPGNNILTSDEIERLSFDEDSIYGNFIRLNVKRSMDNNLSLEKKLNSYGSSKKDALSNASFINFNYFISDSNLFLNNYFSIDKSKKFKGQSIDLTVYIPLGQIVYFDKSLENILHDVQNTSNTWDGDMIGKKWIMLEEGLTCLECED